MDVRGPSMQHSTSFRYVIPGTAGAGLLLEPLYY